MNPIGAGARKICPGRCDRCGCLVVLVRLQDQLSEIEPLRRVGWRCLMCDRIVDLHSIVNRREPQRSASSHRWHQRQRSRMRHVHSGM